MECFRKEQHVYLGNNVYKIRLKTPDIAKGKNKSFRLVVLIVEIGKFIIPLAIYFKGDQENISKKELNDYLEMALLEMRTKKLL